MHTKFTLVTTRKDLDNAGVNSAPAICVWLDGCMDLKWALLQKLREYGPEGCAAAMLLEAEDPRLVTYRPERSEPVGFEAPDAERAREIRKASKI